MDNEDFLREYTTPSSAAYEAAENIRHISKVTGMLIEDTFADWSDSDDSDEFIAEVWALLDNDGN